MTEPTNTIAPLLRRLLYGLTNWSLFVAGMVNLGVGTWSAAAHADAAIAATSLTAGLVLLFAATIDRFESLKGLGIEAKTRKLDEKIEQADEALRKIRQLAELTGASLVDLHSKMGRWDSAPSPREALALTERVRSIMLALGSEPPALASALRPWARILCHDLASSFTVFLNKLVTEKIHELETLRQAIPQPMNPNDSELHRLTKEINVGHAYIADRLRKIHQFDLDDYPECFMAIFENVPYIISEELLPLREKAARFASDMNTLKRSMSLPNPEVWMHELEEARRNKI
jgi:hypothetical protein